MEKIGSFRGPIYNVKSSKCGVYDAINEAKYEAHENLYVLLWTKEGEGFP